MAPGEYLACCTPLLRQVVMRQTPDYMKMWNSKPFVIFFAIVAAVSVLFLYLSWRTTQLYDHLLHNGIQTSGKVVEYYVHTGSRGYGQNHYYVYRFLDSRNQTHERRVIRNEPDSRIKVGHNIEIIYDPLDPGKNIAAIMMPADIYQPIYSSLKFMAAALGVTLAFGSLVFSKFAQTRLRWTSIRRLFDKTDR